MNRSKLLAGVLHSGRSLICVFLATGKAPSCYTGMDLLLLVKDPSLS